MANQQQGYVPHGVQTATVQERQRMALLRAKQDILRQRVASGDMTPQEANDAWLKITTQIDPMERRKIEANMAHQKAQEQYWQQQAAHQEIRDHQRQVFHGQLFDKRLQTYVDPETGEKHKYYLDEKGDPKAPPWEQHRYDRKMASAKDPGAMAADAAKKAEAERKAHDADFDRLSKMYKIKDKEGKDTKETDFEAITLHQKEREKHWQDMKAAEQSKRAQAIDQQRQVDAAARKDTRTPEQVAAARAGVPDPKDFPDEAVDQGGGVGGNFTTGDVSNPAAAPAAAADQTFPGGMVARGGAAGAASPYGAMPDDPRADMEPPAVDPQATTNYDPAAPVIPQAAPPGMHGRLYQERAADLPAAHEARVGMSKADIIKALADKAAAEQEAAPPPADDSGYPSWMPGFLRQ